MRISPILQKLITQQNRIDKGDPYSLDEILETYIVSLSDPEENKKMKPGFHV
jgi:hypothetical protein